MGKQLPGATALLLVLAACAPLSPVVAERAEASRGAPADAGVEASALPAASPYWAKIEVATVEEGERRMREKCPEGYRVLDQSPVERVSTPRVPKGIRRRDDVPKTLVKLHFECARSDDAGASER
jgi:hypothetical protein